MVKSVSPSQSTPTSAHVLVPPWTSHVTSPSPITILRLVYLENVFLAGTKRDVTKVYAQVVDRCNRARFLISLKSVTKPSKQLDFIGKAIDMQRCTVSDKTS